MLLAPGVATMLAVMATTTAVSVGSTMIAADQQGKNAKAQAAGEAANMRYQADIANRNAKIQQASADRARKIGEVNAQREGRELRMRSSSSQAAAASAGLTEGSGEDVLWTQKLLGASPIVDARFQGEDRAFNFELAALGQQDQAGINKLGAQTAINRGNREASAARLGGIMSSVGQVAGAASKIPSIIG